MIKIKKTGIKGSIRVCSLAVDAIQDTDSEMATVTATLHIESAYEDRFSVELTGPIVEPLSDIMEFEYDPAAGEYVEQQRENPLIMLTVYRTGTETMMIGNCAGADPANPEFEIVMRFETSVVR